MISRRAAWLMMVFLGMIMIITACGIVDTISSDDSSEPDSSVSEYSSEYTSVSSEGSESIQSITASSSLYTSLPSPSPSPSPTIKAPTAAPSVAVSKAPKFSDVKTSEILFGIYHTTPEFGHDIFFEYAETDWFSTTIISALSPDFEEIFEVANENNVMIWTTLPDIYNFARTLIPGRTGDSDADYFSKAVLRSDWKSTIDGYASVMKQPKFKERWLGYYFDEPELYGIDFDEFEMITAYLRQKSDCRIMMINSVAAFAPEIWTNDYATTYTAKNLQNVTDIGFDGYPAFNESYMLNIIDKMLERVDDPDKHLWVVPATMCFQGAQNEQYAIDHLTGYYKILKESANPGGIMCYSYRDKDFGLSIVLNPNREYRWYTLFDLIKRIGKEIATQKAFGR